MPVELKEGLRSAVETADIHLDFHMSIPRSQDRANLEPNRKKTGQRRYLEKQRAHQRERDKPKQGTARSERGKLDHTSCRRGCRLAYTSGRAKRRMI